MTTVDITLIASEGNVRSDMGDLTALAQDIDRRGLIQPIAVAPRGEGYVVIDGHRRLEACRNLGEQDIEVFVYPYIEEQSDMTATQFVANQQRKALTAYEQAQATLDLKQAGLKQGDVALELGLSKAEVSHLQKAARTVKDLPNQEQVNQLSVEALFDLADHDFFDDAEPDERALVLENAVRAIAIGESSSVRNAIGNAEREAKDVQILSYLEPILARLHDCGVQVVQQMPGRSDVLARHHLDTNYGNQLGFNEKEVELHRTLDCHVAHMGSGWSGMVLTEYCIKPSSHREKGKSGLKEASAEEKQKQREDERAERKATKEAKQLRIDAVKDVATGRWTQKQMLAISRSILNMPQDVKRVMVKALELKNVDSPYGSYPDYDAMLNDWMDTLSPAQQSVAPVLALAGYTYIEGTYNMTEEIKHLFEGGDK